MSFLSLSSNSIHDGQQAAGLCVWLVTAGYSRVQLVSHCPQHSPGGMTGLGQEGLGHNITLQSCLHVLQQSHLIIGTGHSVELPHGAGGGGRVISSGRPLWVKQHLLSSNII